MERKENSEKNKGNTRGDVKRIDGLDVQWAIYYFNEEAWFDRWIRVVDCKTRLAGKRGGALRGRDSNLCELLVKFC